MRGFFDRLEEMTEEKVESKVLPVFVKVVLHPLRRQAHRPQVKRILDLELGVFPSVKLNQQVQLTSKPDSGAFSNRPNKSKSAGKLVGLDSFRFVCY